ncbi:nitroreductase/quinone reductase family protein [Gordonia rhizosphera]|uniref:Nitroreductase n=1 Tax=Gordonia rhizosphera NBRC 16068 TaxID=1108045 RepID=K6VA28_9ACTN|nr:nitroreductase/quinone reductase family protein [Gordonia rhizosphera]GAB93073.1 hypothetical protein GORHZ_205_00150 [Gordonia rhizosphera NBRC 16068]
MITHTSLEAAHARDRTLAVILRWTTIALGALALGYLMSVVLRVVVWRARWQPAIDALRRYQKNFGNRRSLRSGGKRRQSVALVHHAGRRSGEQYVTPVWAHRVGQSFFVGLPYGTAVDWLRNVRAAGACDIEHDGVRYHTVAPTIVATGDVPEKLARKRKLFDLMGIRSFVRLDIDLPEDSSTGSAVTESVAEQDLPESVG